MQTVFLQSWRPWAVFFLLFWGASAWGSHIYFSGLKDKTLAAMRNQAVEETRRSIQQNVSSDFEVGFKAAARLAYSYNKEILLWESPDEKASITEKVNKLSQLDGIAFIKITDVHGKVLIQSAKDPDSPIPSMPEQQSEIFSKAVDIDGFPMPIMVSVVGKEKSISIMCRSEATYAQKPVGNITVGMTMQLFLPENPYTSSFYQWSLLIIPLTLFTLFFILYFLIKKFRQASETKGETEDKTEPQPFSQASIPTSIPFNGKTLESERLERKTERDDKIAPQAVPDLLQIDPEDVTGEEKEYLGPYKLVQKLAMGGMAELFIADHEGEDGFRRQVVVKRILPHLINNTQFVKRFVEEARLTAFLQHPNIVQITDYGKIAEHCYIVMEYIRGKNIAEIMEIIQKGFKLKQVVYIISQICRGLHYSHTKNIIHRDISPHNIMISFQGEVKISDYGIARMGAGTGLTTGILGKLNYLSPEQAMGKADEVDQQSDIFSLGILFYEMLTGRNLYKSDNDIELLRMIPEQDVKPVQDLRQDTPNALNHIVMKCLQKNKADRYGTAKEILDDMVSFRNEMNMIYDSDDLSSFMKRCFLKDSF